MNMMKKVLYVLLTLFIAANIYIIVTKKFFLYKVIRYNLADIDDYQIFPQRSIQKSSSPQPWQHSPLAASNKFSPQVSKYLEELETVALLIIKEDTIRYEKYWESYSETSLSNSFSMAKSYVSALIGVALQEGKIKTIDVPVSNFLPEYAIGDKGKITIRHLLTMSSGLNWEENYFSPVSTVTEAYYGNNLKGLLKELKVVVEPGTQFRYKGGDTQILAFILQEIYQQPLSKIAEDKLWKPLGAESDALWSLDTDGGDEKASCCLNSNARDFARIGKLYLNHGIWNGQQIIPSNFIDESTKGINLPDTENNRVDYYGFQWWIIPEFKGEKIFYARGVGGQYIIVAPREKMIIVRLGKKRGEKAGHTFK